MWADLSVNVNQTVWWMIFIQRFLSNFCSLLIGWIDGFSEILFPALSVLMSLHWSDKQAPKESLLGRWKWADKQAPIRISSWQMKMSRQTGAYKNFFLADEKCKFDLETNWNILNGKHRPEFPISLQNFLNGIWFRIKLKLTDWKKQARNSLIFANLP